MRHSIKTCLGKKTFRILPNLRSFLKKNPNRALYRCNLCGMLHMNTNSSIKHIIEIYERLERK